MNGYWNGGTLKFNKHWQGGTNNGTVSGMYGIRRGDDIVVAPPSYRLHIDLSDYEEVEFDARVRRWIGSQPLYGYGLTDNLYQCRLEGKKWSDVDLIPFISLDAVGYNTVAGLDGGFADKSLMPYDLGLWQRWHDIYGLSDDTDYVPISSLTTNVNQKPFLYCKADIINVTGRADGGNINEVINSGYYIENLDDNGRYVTDGDKVSFIMKTGRYGSPFNTVSFSIDEWDNLDSLISGVDIPNVVISGNQYQVTPYEYMTVLPYACAREWQTISQEKGNRNGDAVIGGILSKVTSSLISPVSVFIKGTASEVFTGDGLYVRMKAPMDFGTPGTFYIKIKEVKSDRVYRISDMVGNI